LLLAILSHGFWQIYALFRLLHVYWTATLNLSKERLSLSIFWCANLLIHTNNWADRLRLPMKTLSWRCNLLFQLLVQLLSLQLYRFTFLSRWIFQVL
jgi:hypothetical protein